MKLNSINGLECTLEWRRMKRLLIVRSRYQKWTVQLRFQAKREADLIQKTDRADVPVEVDRRQDEAGDQDQGYGDHGPGPGDRGPDTGAAREGPNIERVGVETETKLVVVPETVKDHNQGPFLMTEAGRIVEAGRRLSLHCNRRLQVLDANYFHG